MMNFLKESFVDVKAADRMTAEQLQGKFLMGEFKHNTQLPEYSAEYQKIVDRLRKE